MERGVKLLDFENVDQMVQVHGQSRSSLSDRLTHPIGILSDYEGVSLSSRTPESKAAAAEATNIFQSHYPELLVSPLP